MKIFSIVGQNGKNICVSVWLLVLFFGANIDNLERKLALMMKIHLNDAEFIFNEVDASHAR